MKCDRHVLIEAWVGEKKGLEVRYGSGTLAVFSGDSSCINTRPLQAVDHPGVPVAALVEECDFGRRHFMGTMGGDTLSSIEMIEWCKLYTARTAANKPKEEWLRVHRTMDGKMAYRSLCIPADATTPRLVELREPHPDDILTEEPVS